MGLPVSNTARAPPGKMGPLVLDGEVLLDEGADEPQQAFAVVAGLEVHPTLRARKRAAMQGDQGQPFGLAAGPAEGRELASAIRQRRDRGGALGARVDLGRAAGHRVTRARSPRPSGLRISLGLTIIRARSRVGIHGHGRARVQRRDPALDVRRASAAVVTDAHPVAGQHGRYFGPEFFAGVLHAAEVPGTVLECVSQSRRNG